MAFDKEADFEEALIAVLMEKHGWGKADELRRPTEQDLIANWARILYENNRMLDRLGDYPLTDSEMQQILEQIARLRTPLKLNGFINGKTVSIKRDNPNDVRHYGKEVSLKIYDRMEVQGGQSCYQIAQQPVFAGRSNVLNDRRGDLMLLINGMPLFHLELKKSGVPVSQACNQIEKYAHEGVFTGLFALVQIFVAMNPEETRYFANPGPDGKFNPDYYFHWADFDNEPINGWQRVADSLLSIPMAHQLIGFYSVADDSDGVLKVMRSYQYYAASKISDVVTETNKNKWEDGKQRGGYVWHTTGSGKTMTSFKSAQLIANSQDADKVIFLTDRIELGTQSLKEYRAFADENESVQGTENTYVLLNKLKSSAAADTLIVTSIQKMSNIQNEEGGRHAHDIAVIGAKRLVFIVDEAHRSTFGDMLRDIKNTFPRALFFGFTGTPVFPENARRHNDQTDVFGNELHRYSIADGIRDKNVLGFDPYKVLTYRDKDLREAVALDKAHAATVAEALSDPAKAEVYYHYMDPTQVKMYSEKRDDDSWNKGIEDELPKSQYQRDEHRNKVVEDIRNNWLTLSHNGKFHAIFATSSIPEAIKYYRLLKTAMPELKTSCLVDPNIDNNGNDGENSAIAKEDGLVEIINDYNARYGQDFTLARHAYFKKDIALRLAHKEQYQRIELERAKQLDLLIVVDQMLTGFDSKWVNTLYMDKVLQYENIIQAFSRTNRLFGPEKPFGVIRYYRKPHTMEQNVINAFKLYSGERPYGLFVDKLPHNLAKLNEVYRDIAELFTSAGVPDFEKLPEEQAVKAKFALLFRELNGYLEAAKVQGFKWEQKSYVFTDEKSGKKAKVTMAFDENDYLTLAQRYKELSKDIPSGGGGDVPYDTVGYLTEINTEPINTDYMNNRFKKWLKLRKQEGSSGEALEQAKAELHKSFASLTQEEQKYANIFLHDIERGEVTLEPYKTVRDYITEYLSRAKNDQIHHIAEALGLDEKKLREMINLGLNDGNINEYGRYDALKKTVDKTKAKEYFDAKLGRKLILPMVNRKTDTLLRKFITSGGLDF
jgi:type I restriction enzyme, R subunit